MPLPALPCPGTSEKAAVVAAMLNEEILTLILSAMNNSRGVPPLDDRHLPHIQASVFFCAFLLYFFAKRRFRRNFGSMPFMEV